MDPRTLAITLDRALPPAAGIGAWQGNPLRFTLTVADGEDLADADTIRTELRDSQAAETLLAAVDTGVSDEDGPWTVDFTAAQMAQTIREGNKKRALWLEINALYADGRRETLAARNLTLHRTGDVTLTPPDAPALFQTATLTYEDGIATLTIGGTSITFPSNET